VLDILNVTLVPYGNSRTTGGKTTCQHGENECIADSIEQCAIDIYPEFTKHYPFLYCMEGHGSNMLKYTEECSKTAGLNYTQIEACSNDAARVVALQARFAAMTPSDHKYTPWILVNGVLSKSDGDKLLDEVCTAYTGTWPAGCNTVLRETNQKFSADW